MWFLFHSLEEWYLFTLQELETHFVAHFTKASFSDSFSFNFLLFFKYFIRYLFTKQNWNTCWCLWKPYIQQLVKEYCRCKTSIFWWIISIIAGWQRNLRASSNGRIKIWTLINTRLTPGFTTKYETLVNE